MKKKNLDDLIKGDKRLHAGRALSLYLRYWWVLLAGAVIFAALGFLFSRIKSEKYDIHARIILNDTDDNSSGSLGGGLGSLIGSFNMGGSSYKLVDDETHRIQSHDNLLEVVRRLGLNNVSWSKSGFLSPKVFYYGDAPLKVETAPSVLDTIRTATHFNIKVAEGGRDISVKVKQGKTKLEGHYTSFPIRIKTPLGVFTVSRSATYDPSRPLHFYASLSNPSSAAEALFDKIVVNSPSKKSNIISLDYEDVIPERGRDVLNTVIAVYNEKGVVTSHEEARQAVAFIEDRLMEMYKTLQNSEGRIEDYKKRNRIIDPEAEAEYMFKKKEAVEGAIVEQQTRAGVIRMVLDFLRPESNHYSLVPFTADIPEAPISAYNELVLQRMQLEGNAKGNNSALRSITAQIDAMRSNLITTLERSLDAARIAQSDMQRVSSQSDARMSGVPTMERELLSLYRDQKIQNQIYAFLLQKREENQLKLAREVPVGRIVDNAYESTTPSGPGAMLIMAGFAFFGIILSASGLWLVDWYTRRREEMANAGLPAED